MKNTTLAYLWIFIIGVLLMLSFVGLPAGKAADVDECKSDEVRLENGVNKGCTSIIEYKKEKKRLLRDYEAREARGYDFDINDLPFLVDVINIEMAGKEMKGYTKEQFRLEIVNLLKK